MEKGLNWQTRPEVLELPRQEKGGATVSPFWRGVLVAVGFTVGVAIVGLLAVIAYALLSGDGHEPAAEVARITTTATASPTVTPMPVATLSPTALPPTPSPEPEQPTPVAVIVREEAPPPTQESPQPSPIPAGELDRMCSDKRAQVELYDIVVPDLFALSTEIPLPSEAVRREVEEARTFVAIYCQGQGLTPVPSQSLSMTCSQAGELRGQMNFYLEDPVGQQVRARLNEFITKYCGR